MIDLDALLNRQPQPVNTAGVGAQAQDLLDMNTVSQAIIEAEGDLALVAERLLGNKNLQDQVLALISADRTQLDAFSAKTRAFALVKTIGIFSALSYSVLMKMPDLKPEDTVKAFIKIADVMERMTAKPAQTSNNTVNVFETILASVPPHVGNALREVISIPAPALQALAQAPAQAESEPSQA